MDHDDDDEEEEDGGDLIAHGRLQLDDHDEKDDDDEDRNRGEEEYVFVVFLECKNEEKRLIKKHWFAETCFSFWYCNSGGK